MKVRVIAARRGRRRDRGGRVACSRRSRATEEQAAEEADVRVRRARLGNPFIQQIIDGAKAAGRDLGVTVKAGGLEHGDANDMLKAIRDFFAAGADGVATSCQSESLVKPLNQLSSRRGSRSSSFNITLPRPERAVRRRALREQRPHPRPADRRQARRRRARPARSSPASASRASRCSMNRNKGVVEGLKKAAPKLKREGPVRRQGRPRPTTSPTGSSSTRRTTTRRRSSASALRTSPRSAS